MDGDGQRQALRREHMGQAHVMGVGVGRGGSTTALGYRFLIRPGSRLTPESALLFPLLWFSSP